MEKEEFNAKLTVKLPYSLRKEFKIACEERDTDTSKVIRKLMRKWLDEQKTPGGAGTP
jgi:metal-responsive CopG/Arc/MetJ family transcriptional regulator